MPRLSLRLPDVILIATLAAVSASVWAIDFKIASALLALFTGIVAWASSGPAAWIRDCHEKTGESPLTAVKNLRKAGARLPPPFPDAWFAVCLSDELQPGELKTVTICGKSLVVWRAASTGKASVFDAYCPHLGAHLGLGGGSVVPLKESEGDGKKDCLRCPFHGWKFDSTGACVEAPGSEKRPSGTGSSVPSWPAKEQNGVISVWMGSHVHRASSGAEAAVMKGNEPWFQIPTFPELNNHHRFDYAGFTENLVPCHLLEIPENGSDVAHLPALHANFVLSWLRPWFSHEWAATWTPHAADKDDDNKKEAEEKNKDADGWGKHIADITIQESMVFLRRYELPGSRVSVNITQCGPSQVVLQMRTPVGPITLVETVSPVHPLLQRVLHAAFIPQWMPLLAAKVVLWGTLKQFEADVPIWSQKQYASKPFLSGADRAIPAYRRWVSQFYDAKRGPGNLPPPVSFAEAATQHARDLLGLPAEVSPSALAGGSACGGSSDLAW